VWKGGVTLERKVGRGIRKYWNKGIGNKGRLGSLERKVKREVRR